MFQPTDSPRPAKTGITVNQLQSCSGGREALPPGSLLPALLCVAGSVTVPSAASVYNEFALKKHMDTSVHLQNFFLYFYGALFNLAGLVITCAAKPLAGVGNLFDGLSPVTTLIIVNNAAQVGGPEPGTASWACRGRPPGPLRCCLWEAAVSVLPRACHLWDKEMASWPSRAVCGRIHLQKIHTPHPANRPAPRTADRRHRMPPA